MSPQAQRTAPRPDIAPTLPHDRAAERAILGAVLLDDEYQALHVAAERLSPEDFYLPEHRHIFEAMTKLAANALPITTVTLQDFLVRNDQLAASGGVAYLSGLADGLPRITAVDHYARIVQEHAKLRRLFYISAKIEAQVLEREDSATIIEQTEVVISSLRASETPAETLVFADMPEAVLDSWLGDLCERIRAGLPRAYVWPALLCAAGVLVPRMPHVRTNLYMCLVGQVGTGKTVAPERATEVLGVIKPQLETTLAGSAEGLFGGETFLSANGDARLLAPDELGHLLTKAQIDRASFPFVLNTAFYKDQFDLIIARGKTIPVNVRLSVMGGIVETNFETCFGSATTGGLHDRFIFGRCPEPFSYLYRPFQGSVEQTEPCSVIIAGDVWEARDGWMRTIPGLNPRVAELAIRAAVIAAAFSGRTILYGKHLDPAQAFAEYQTRIRAVLKPNPGENSDARCAFAILAALDDKDGGWHGKRDVAKRIHFERYGPSVFERAVSALEAAGEIYINKKYPIRLRRIGPK
jgi:hypothetical protein